MSAGISIHALLAESDKLGQVDGTNVSHFYPRSPCGERRSTAQCLYNLSAISIHALLAESDLIIEERRKAAEQFLSTLSLRRATPQYQPERECR